MFITILLILITVTVDQQLAASHRIPRTSAVLQSSSIRIHPTVMLQGIGPGGGSEGIAAGATYDPKTSDTKVYQTYQDPGGRRRLTVASPYSKRYHYSSPERSQSSYHYGRVYDSTAKKYESSPSKISYEIKLYIPKHEEVLTKTSYMSPHDESPSLPVDYTPYAYEERSLYSSSAMAPPASPKYMKPHYVIEKPVGYSDSKLYHPGKRPLLLYPASMDYESVAAPAYRPLSYQPTSQYKQPSEMYRPGYKESVLQDGGQYEPPSRTEGIYQQPASLPVYDMSYRPVHQEYEVPVQYGEPPPNSYKGKVKPETYATGPYGLSSSYEPPYDQQQMKTTYDKAKQPAPPEVYQVEGKYPSYEDAASSGYQEQPSSGLYYPASAPAQQALYYALAYPGRPSAEVPAYFQTPSSAYSHYMAPPLTYPSYGYGAYAHY